jgi:hypothetical protein
VDLEGESNRMRDGIEHEICRVRQSRARNSSRSEEEEEEEGEDTDIQGHVKDH